MKEIPTILTYMDVSSAYVIDKIYVDGVCLGPIPSYTFEDVTCDHTISALFLKEDQQTFTITTTAGPEGNISPEGVHTVSWKKDMTFTITAEADFLLYVYRYHCQSYYQRGI